MSALILLRFDRPGQGEFRSGSMLCWLKARSAKNGSFEAQQRNDFSQHYLMNGSDVSRPL
jgi:hypothetical protein